MSNGIAVSSDFERAILAIGALAEKINAILSPEPPEPVDQIPQYVTRQRAAELLGCNVRTIDRKIREGRLKRYMLSGRVRLLLSDVEALIK